MAVAGKLKEREPMSQETQGMPPQPSKKDRRQAEPMRDYKTELQWIADHAREYKWQWVSLDGDRLIAPGANADEALDAAEADGANPPWWPMAYRNPSTINLRASSIVNGLNSYAP